MHWFEIGISIASSKFYVEQEIAKLPQLATMVVMKIWKWNTGSSSENVIHHTPQYKSLPRNIRDHNWESNRLYCKIEDLWFPLLTIMTSHFTLIWDFQKPNVYSEFLIVSHIFIASTFQLLFLRKHHQQKWRTRGSLDCPGPIIAVHEALVLAISWDSFFIHAQPGMKIAIIIALT